MDYHNNQEFSTKDADNDQKEARHCATFHGGGGNWYKWCYHQNLNGVYPKEGDVKREEQKDEVDGMAWWYMNWLVKDRDTGILGYRSLKTMRWMLREVD